MEQGIPPHISQYSHRPMNFIVFDTEELFAFVASLMAMVPLTILLGLKGLAIILLIWTGLGVYHNLKRKFGRGFLQRLLYKVGLLRISGSPVYREKKFRS